MKSLIDKEEHQNVINLVLQGYTDKEIAKKYKVGKSTISRLKKKYGVKSVRDHERRKKPPKVCIIGKTFGHLIVIGYKKLFKNQKWSYVANCNCLNCGGTNILVNIQELKSGRRLSCGCLHHTQPKRERSPTYKGYGLISGQRWSQIRCGAIKRKHEFNITIRESWEIYLKQKKRCALTNLPIDFQKTSIGTYNASLDRIDSSKGYISGNIQWVHKDVNLMKRNFSEIYFFKLCKLITENIKV